MMDFCMEAIPCIARILAGIFAVAYFAKLEKPGKKEIAIGLLLGLGVCLLWRLPIMDSLGNAGASGQISFDGVDSTAILRILSEAFIILGIIGYFMKAPMSPSAFVVAYYAMLYEFWNFVVSVSLSMAFRNSIFMDKSCLQGKIGPCLISGVAVAVVAFLFLKKDLEEKTLIKIYTYVAILGMFFCVTISEQDVIDIPADTMSMWLTMSVILVSGISVIMLMKVYKQYGVEKELAQLKTEQAELLEQDYTNLNNSYAMNAKLFHDLHNHIGILRQMLTTKQYEAAVAYLDELQAPVKEMTDQKWTGDGAIDYLINSKAVKANENHIALQIHVEFPNHTNLKGADLCAIIGNLLDNALEAARQVPDEQKRFVNFTIRRINQMLMIKVENSFAANLVEKDGQLQTTKKDGGLHGWGIKSANTAAEKYDGCVRTSTEGNVFRAVASLNFEGVELPKSFS